MNAAVKIGKNEYRVEFRSDEFYGEFWGAINLKTGRPHAMRDTEQEAIADLEYLAEQQKIWEQM